MEWADSTPYHALSHLLASFGVMVVWLIYSLIPVHTLHAQYSRYFLVSNLTEQCEVLL
jgi:hypothetical protein